MRNEKLAYSTPSVKVSIIEEDILTWSPNSEGNTFEEMPVTDKAAE